MEHLENHPYAALDENNFVNNIIVFSEHDSSLIEQVKEHLNVNQIISCCEFGEAQIDYYFYNNVFYPPKPYPSWVFTGTGWTAPVPRPDSGWWKWNEEILGWQETSILS